MVEERATEGCRYLLCELFGHDSMGHRLSNVLAREGLLTPELIRQQPDAELLEIRTMGAALLNRLHQRMDHCPEWGRRP